MATKEEIQKLLREAITPLEEKVDNLNHSFQELKKTVVFFNQKYDEVLSQLGQTNEKVKLQGTNLRKMQQDYDDAKIESREAILGYENLAQYLRRDYLEISGIPPSENYSSNDIVMAVGQAIEVAIKEEDISISHPLPSFSSDAPKIIVKFTRRDIRNAFYANRRKLINKKTNELAGLGLEEEEENVYISESLTRYKKNKLKKKIKWKHIWTQNGRIFLKEAERSKPVVIDSHDDLTDLTNSTPLNLLFNPVYHYKENEHTGLQR